jgi:hypothetical protein
MEAITPVLTVLIVVGLAIYAFDRMPVPIKDPAKSWIAALIALGGAAYLVQRFLV